LCIFLHFIEHFIFFNYINEIISNLYIFQQKLHQKILSSSAWASQQPIDSSIISRSPPQQLINNYSFQPSKSLPSSDKPTLNSQSAVNSNLPQQTVYSVVLQNRPHQPTEDDSTTQVTTKSPIKKVSNIPHTSPRPGILGFYLKKFFLFAQFCFQLKILGIVKQLISELWVVV